VAIVGGKNASLGELISTFSAEGIRVPDGFATTADAFRLFIDEGGISEPLGKILGSLDEKEFSNLREVGAAARTLMSDTKLPGALIAEITDLYGKLCTDYTGIADVAVRSSATAEDLPDASFAGQHESFLHISGLEEVLNAIKKCFVSLYTDRAIKYRHDHGFDQMKIALSAGVQLMVRSDLAGSGVIFTLEPESGFRDVIQIAACWGLGENIVQGTVSPDEYTVFKPTLRKDKYAVVSKKLGTKAKTLIYEEGGGHGLINTDTPAHRQEQFVLSDEEIALLAKWSLRIEEHYKRPMDIEWAKDGNTGLLYIVQARPETVHSSKDPLIIREYVLGSKGTILAKGNAVGKGIAGGVARILKSPAEGAKLRPGEILVTDMTNPDWDPVLKRAAAIVTNKGGRTSHAAIVARELGAVGIVGTSDATERIKDGQYITVSCAESRTGVVYEGKLDWTEKQINLRDIAIPDTQAMMILGDPEKAFTLSFYPNHGVGLMRLEFIINSSVKVHPMALINYAGLKDKDAISQIDKITAGYADKTEYFVDKLSQAVSTIAAAFYPKDVIVRMSDFKSNEYASLVGGKEFEPQEENPMLGFRGASRYYHERYREGFRLECMAMLRVRNKMGLTNVKLMIPFCRTVEEGKKVVDLMAEYGLKRGEEGLEIYVMAEIPSNVIQATEFARVFDGFSIGSNDLTQLTLGLDRDSEIVSSLFDENNPSVKKMISSVIRDAHQAGVKIGLCGQAPSDFPEFAGFLVKEGIDSISFNPDALLKGIQNMAEAEKNL
jgi:pyruvate,water dikinase